MALTIGFFNNWQDHLVEIVLLLVLVTLIVYSILQKKRATQTKQRPKEQEDILSYDYVDNLYGMQTKIHNKGYQLKQEYDELNKKLNQIKMQEKILKNQYSLITTQINALKGIQPQKNNNNKKEEDKNEHKID